MAGEDPGSGHPDRDHPVDWDELLRRLEQEPPEPGWVTVEEAATAASISRSTLRSWYRNGHIPSRMVAGVHGPHRLVPLQAVLDRALQSPRLQKSIDKARSLEEEVRELRRRVDALELLLGLRLEAAEDVDEGGFED